jgi:hypothetical protein
VLLAVLAWGAGAAFHPGTAKSFVGESLVEAAGGGLTKAAEKVVQAGKFVPELVARGATQGGAAEASEVASTFEAAGALPVLSSFAAFGVGTKVGSEICGAIGIEGCWYGASETADPPVGGKGHYVFLANSPITGPNGVPHYMYWYNESGYVALWKGWGGEPKGAEGCGIEPPTSVQAFAPSASSVDCKGRSVESGALYRYAMANRTLEYHATDDPAIPNATPQWCPQGSACVFTQPSGWAANLANVLSSSAGAETATREKVGQAIAHAIDPTAVAEPFAIEGTVPNCGGRRG